MRIKVDFSEFFDDERKLSVVNVNKEESETVRDVLHKIIRMFKLSTPKRSRRGNQLNERLEYGLFEEGFYIPPEETSTVLQDIGILKLKSLLASVKTETQEGKKKKHKKIKVEEEEEEQPVESDDEKAGKKRRSKRHKVQVEECSKEKKSGRRKDKAEEDDDEGESAKIRRQSSKKSRRGAPAIDAECYGEEEVKRSKRRGRRQAESDDSEESNGPKKRKLDILLRESTDGTSAEELEDVSSKEKKKSKRNRTKLDLKLEEVEGGVTKGKSDDATDTKKKKKCTRQSLVEEDKASTVQKSMKIENQEEKRSQEKEISTSNVIHVESEEASEESGDSVSGSSGSHGAVDAGHTISVSSVSKKRKRKHKRKKERVQNVPEEIGMASQSSSSKTGENPIMPTHFDAAHSPYMNTRRKNFNVSTSSEGTHVFFPTDDEEEVTSVSHVGDGKDIEILAETSGPTKKHTCAVTQSSNKDLDSQSPVVKQAIIDIEGEDSSPADHPQSNYLLGDVTDSIRRSYSQKSHVSFDDFDNLRRMYERKTVTVVSVSSRKKTVTSTPIEVSYPISHPRRGPPHPVQSPIEINASTRRMFDKLLSLENRGEPLLLRTYRDAMMDLAEDADGDATSKTVGSMDAPARSSLNPTQNTSVGNSAADSCELICMPSTSGYTDTNDAPVDLPGPSTRAARKGAPRSFRALGQLLSNLRSPDDAKEAEELQVITSNEDDIQDIPSSPEVIIKQELLSAKGDNDITSSTIGEIDAQEVIVPEELSTLKDVIDDSPSYDPGDPLYLYDEEETRNMMEAMIAQGLKEDMLKEVKDTQDDEDGSFMKYPLMKTLPKSGEFIAIKVLSLDEDLRPVHSKYIKVQVVEVSGMNIKLKKVQNPKKKEEVTKVKVEDGVEEVDLTFEEEVDLTEDDQADVLALDWRDIVEPRLLFP